MQGLLVVSRAIDATTRFVGYHVRWFILAAVVVSAFNAIIRRLFNSSSNAWLELQWLCFGAVFMLAAAYVLQKNAHVRIDVVSNRLSRRTRNWIDLAGHVFMLAPLSLIMALLSVRFFVDAYVGGEMSGDPGGLPMWPAKLIILAGFVLLFAQMLSQVIKTVALLTGHLDDSEPAGSDQNPHEVVQ
jgi:TRAP-type mannitol/chloroaromatic compound transport system permease small subunit